MTNKISKYQELMNRLKAENKVTYLDTKKDIEIMIELDKEMEKVWREYQIKERNSEISAANVILTA